MITVPRLKISRHGVFCLRVYWRDPAGRLRESLHSLGTKNAALARVAALHFNAAYESKRAMTDKPNFLNLDELIRKYELDLSRGVMKSEGAEDHALMMQAIAAYKDLHGTFPPLQEAMNAGRQHTASQQPALQAAGRVLAKSMVFSVAVAAYLEEKKQSNAEQTIVEKGRTYKDFTDIFGDLDLNLYGKPELVQWKTADLKRGLGVNRINKRLGQVNDFFNWAINHGHYTANPTSPVDGLFIKGGGKLGAKTEHYEPFSTDEVKAIFGSTYPEDMPKPDHYWLPLVALFTGARREELASLKASNVKMVDGVACFLIEKGKTADARRVVPIHPDLAALGFMDYARHVQSMDEEFLFPYLVDGANGRGKNAGRQFAALLDKRKIKDERKVFHSFRHTVITRLHALGSNPAHVMQIVGHASEGGQSVHFQTYTHDVGLQALAQTLEKLNYPLDIEALKMPDPTFRLFLNRWKLAEQRKARVTKNADDHCMVTSLGFQ